MWDLQRNKVVIEYHTAVGQNLPVPVLLVHDDQSVLLGTTIGVVKLLDALTGVEKQIFPTKSEEYSTLFTLSLATHLQS